MGDERPELRASDADRERVADRLRDALAEGRLDMEEFGQRLDQALRARTYGELEPLTADLPAHSMAKAGTAGEVESWSDRIGGPATSRGAFAFWSGFGRQGRWTVARRFTAFAMWGGGEIDLREARFEDREIEIRCFTIMGGIMVKVPPELHVEVTGLGFMGGFDNSTSGTPSPGSPRVRITGFALMGGVGVEARLTKAEKQRLREERRRERKGLE